MNKYTAKGLKYFVASVLFGTCILLHVVSALAQKQGNVWAFGMKAGLDFNSGAPVGISTSIEAREGVASICNGNGQLLFYTDGSNVWDHNNNLMPNGVNLTGLPPVPYTDTAAYKTVTGSCSQGGAIVMMPGNPYLYYVFSLSSSTGGVKADSNMGRLYYSIVDMRLNGGLGDIQPGQKTILIDTGLTEHMTSMPGDRCNVWLLVHDRKGPVIKSYEINPAGINTTPVVSAIGAPDTRFREGTFKASHNGDLLAMGGVSTTQIFDFDGTSGIVSNAKTLYGTSYGVCFSPDDSKLYCTNAGYMYQLDLSLPTTAAIMASRTLIASVFQDIAIGPDGRLYYATTGGVPSVGYLKYPNLPAAQVDPHPNAIPLVPNTSVFLGFPNPNVIVNSDTTFVQNKSVSLTLCPPVNYVLYADTSIGNQYFLWNDGDTSARHVIYTFGDHVVRYLNGCKLHVDTFHVYKTAIMMPVFSSANLGCKNLDNGIAWVRPAVGDTGIHTYEWLDGSGQVIHSYTGYNADTVRGLAAGSYQLHFIQWAGCDTLLLFKIVPATMGGSYILPDTGFCYGDAFVSSIALGDTIKYRWDFGDGNIDSAAAPSHIYAQPGKYKVQLIAANVLLCKDTIVQLVSIDSTPSLRFIASDSIICQGATVTFDVQYSTSGLRELKWAIDDKQIIQGRSNKFFYSFDNVGTFPVSITGKYAHCPDTSFKDIIQVLPFPVVNLGSDTSICPGQAAISLQNSNTQYNTGYHNKWNTGDTKTSISVTTPGVYWLQVANDAGCSTTDSITIAPNCYVNIPNAFTPNGDNINDYFFPRQLLSEGVKSFHMQVFNRWGQSIFETASIDGRGWDGTFNGTPQPEGVYVYLIDVDFINGKSETHRGNITVIR